MSTSRNCTNARSEPAVPAGSTVVLTNEQFNRLLGAAQANIQPAATDAPFALTPALVNMTEPINFTTSEGAKLNKSAVSALPLMFDVESGSINTFNEILMDRCLTSGWNHADADILTIPVGNENRNLIQDYGNITMDQIRNHCQGYVLNHTRQVQHQFQLYQC